MDAIIQQSQFNHDDKRLANERIDALRGWLNQNEDACDGREVLNSVDIFVGKMTQGQCPAYQSEGWKQAQAMFTSVLRQAKHQLEKGILQEDQFHQAVVKLIVDFCRDGPATVQIEMVRNSIPYVQAYTKTLRGNRLKEFLEAVYSPIRIKEDSEEKRVYEFLKHGFRDILTQAFEKSQLQEKEALVALFTFIAHTHLDYSHLDKTCYDHVTSAGYTMYNYVKDYWKGFDEVTVLKGFIQRINGAVKKPGFPRSKADKDHVRKFFYFIRDITQKPGDAATYCDDVFDLLESITQCQTEEVDWLVDLFTGVYDFFSRQPREVIKKDTAFFTKAVPRFRSLIEVIDVQFLTHTRFASYLVADLCCAFDKNKELVPQLVSLVAPLLRRACPESIRGSKNVLYNDEFINWKVHRAVADEVFQAFQGVQIPSRGQQSKDFCDELTSWISYFVKGLKKARILKDYGEGMMLISIKFLEENNEYLFSAAEKVAEHIEIDVKAKKESFMAVMKRLLDLLKNEDVPWLSNRRLSTAVIDLLESTLHSISDGKILSNDDMVLLIDMCVECLRHEGVNPRDSFVSPYYLVAVKVLDKLVSWLGKTKRLGLTRQLIPLFIKTYDEDDTTLCQMNSRFLNEIGQLDPSVLSPYLGQFIKIYLDKDDPNILNPINTVYPKNPQPLKPHFQEMFAQFIDDSNSVSSMWLRQIFLEASKKQPELFTQENTDDLVNLTINDTTYQAISLQILQELSKRKPEKMLRNLDVILDCTEWNPYYVTLVNDILCSLALHSKSVAKKVLDHLLEGIQANQEKATVLTALNGVRLLGFKYPDLIKPKRPDIEKLAMLDGDVQNFKQSILDMIDGKTSDEMKKQLNEQQKTLDDLVDKVDEVEVIVTDMSVELRQQGEAIHQVADQVSKQDQRLDQVEETVEDTVAKVEVIDSKTLSHAPYWSRDISKLLNTQSEHDWRLLSSRLGYSNDDVRGWAQQADPCMAMLNEWYATHKTSEATFAVLTNLQEMDRMDAVIIVENAMKNAEAVVEDEEFEYASPPPVFISYQWGHQQEVKLLKKHLEKAGYECWLDIGQMGGGDKLFEKIDNGIRAAKVVISCVTNKYTKSPNCNREVNLSVGLNKTLIPLQLERCPWPPPGSMGPIFSESLYIRFFQRKGEETTDDRYWAEPKFLELLMQLNMNGLPPDENKIQPEYKNWWIPIEEKISIDKSRTQNGGPAEEDTQTKSDTETESPEVFISYQWGKQKNIIKLYERLTSLGFNCWLDIKQMGGGDSLYDKIDKGIRGSKVVLSCVTQKYALSANCRREVSLADALKRPMIPLLLELMPWPPPGPMSMTMTQLLYIGFTQEDQQLAWKGPEFDELIRKLRQHIPSKWGKQLPTEQSEGQETDLEKAAKNDQSSSDNSHESAHNTDGKEETKPVTESSETMNETVPSDISSKTVNPVTSPKTSTETSPTEAAAKTSTETTPTEAAAKTSTETTPTEAAAKASTETTPTEAAAKASTETTSTEAAAKASTEPAPAVGAAATTSKPRAVVKPMTTEPAAPPIPSPPPPPAPQPPRDGNQKKSKSCTVL